MNFFIAMLLALALCSTCFAQKTNSKVKLFAWRTQACDNTFDAYRLKTRISNIKIIGDKTIFTVNFPDNCCATFSPIISFQENKLILLPYRKYTGDQCFCGCCFTIEYKISGLPDKKKYDIYFKEQKVTLTDEYYDTISPSFEHYKGQKINRTNKYGFKEGLWIEFYKDGKEKVVSQYPEASPFLDSRAEWSKGYYPSGAPSFYDRKDTSESWFEDKSFKSQFIEYKIGDTTFERGFSKFETGQLMKEYSQKTYPIVIKSEFDPSYNGEGIKLETIFRREFFKNGNPSFKFGKDTIFSWFETGKIKLKEYENGSLKFDEGGAVTNRSFSWLEKGPERWRNLENALYIQFYPDNAIKQIELVRDEPTRDGIASGARYSWAWDGDMNLIELPENWKEPFPWTRFQEIQLHPKMLESFKKTPHSGNRH